jgi:hypothetical protein
VAVPSLISLTQLEGGERRLSPRYLVPDAELIVVGVAVMDTEGRPRSLTGRVRDLSASGLSLLLPTEQACDELTERGRPLAVVLTLPAGTIKLRAEVAHCSARIARGLLAGYLVGVCITEINSEDRELLVEYVEERS